MKQLFLGTLKIHDTADSSIGYAVQSPVKGLDFPLLRSSSYDKPGEHGAYMSQLLYGARVIVLQGFIWATDLQTYEFRRRQFEDVLRIVRDTNLIPQPITVKVTTNDSLALQTDAFIRSISVDILNVLNARFQVELFCPDYPLFAQQATQYTLQRAAGGGATYPVIYPVVYGASTGGSQVMVNNGNAESFPVITLNGPLTNPIIQNNTNGRFMEVDLTLNASDQIVIDMKAKTIVLNGNQSVLGNKSSTSQWWWLEKGTNIIKFFTSSAGDSGNAQISYRDAYVGI